MWRKTRKVNGLIAPLAAVIDGQVSDGRLTGRHAGYASAGMPDYRTQMDAQAQEREAENPGRLQLDVEAGEARVPSAEQFRDVLEHAVRIARINANANDVR